MYLSTWNSLPEAVEWLTETTGEQWTWKLILEVFLTTQPETICVVVPLGTPLTQVSPGRVANISLRNPLMAQVCDIQSFLTDLLAGENFGSALANPLALVSDFGNRYHTLAPTPASAIRLSKSQIYDLEGRSFNPLACLIKEIRCGGQPILRSMIEADCAVSDPTERLIEIFEPALRLDRPTDNLSTEHAKVSRVACDSSHPTKIHRSVRKSPILSAEIKQARRTALDPDDPESVWAELLKLAEKVPRVGCLLGIDENSIKYQVGEVVKFFRVRSLSERMKRAAGS